MLPSLRYTLFIFILYPLLGFVTISYFGFPPFYLHTLMIIIVFIQFLDQNTSFRLPKYLLYLLLYMALLAVSLYLVHKEPVRLDTKLALIIFKLNPLLLLLVIENTRISDRFINNSKRLMVMVVIAAAIVSIIQYFSPTFFLFSEKYTGADATLYGYQQRIGSIFTWGDLMNIQYLAIGLSLMYGLLLVEFRNRENITIILSILVGVVMILSQFRIAMFTYLVITISILIRRMSVRSLLIIALTLSTFFLIARLIDFDFNYFYENRLKSETALSRISAFRAFITAFPEKPFFGTGGENTIALYRGFGGVARMHNAHLNIAYYYGIFVFIAHSLFLIYLLKTTFLTGRLANYWAPFFGVVCLMSVMMTEHTVEFYEPGFIILMVFNKYYYDRDIYKRNIEKTTNAFRSDDASLSTGGISRPV